jgi:enterochelin esterase family protein
MKKNCTTYDISFPRINKQSQCFSRRIVLVEIVTSDDLVVRCLQKGLKMLRSLAALVLVAVLAPASAAQQYKYGPDSTEQTDVPKGTITHHTWNSKIFPGTYRDFWVYVPAQYDAKSPACVMVFQDGGNYKNPKGEFKVPIVFDNLIHKKQIPVMVAIFINPGKIKNADGKEYPNRSFEYDSLSNQYALFLEKEILPEVGKKLNLRQDAAGRGISGISSGGICAFTVAWERPDLFSKVLSHVGSFTNIRGGDRYPGIIRKTPTKDIRVFLQDGKKDLDNEHGNWWLGNLQMDAALRFKKYDYKFVPGEGGHDGKHGGAILPESLVWLWRDTPSKTAERSVAGQKDPVATLLQKIKAVGKEGKGNVEAAQAMKVLGGMGPEVLIQVLAAFDDANPVAANYLRAAVQTISDKALAAKKELPAKELEAFVKETKHAGPGRKLAFDLLVRVDAKAQDRLFFNLLIDPGAELRRWAVGRTLKEIETGFDLNPAQVSRMTLQKLLEFARDRDQVQKIAKHLKKFDAEIDLVKHFGFVTQWHIVGPFDSTGGKGYQTMYPPEQKVDLTATYVGKGGKKIKWQKQGTTTKKGEMDLDQLGVVDLNKVIGPLHGTAAYAYTVVQAEKALPVEVRAASNNAVQIFLNGKKIYGREEYHHGVTMDQHIGKGMLKAGANEILIKVCQNEQTEDWAQLWSFQLRLTDALGAPVPVTVALDKLNSKP